MEFDVAKTDARDISKLLTALIVPRPIAWTVTQDMNGKINAAPFSFFNILSGDPPIVALGLGRYGDRLHDTTKNIHQNGEFVINLVTEKQVELMNITAAEFEPGVNELKIAEIDVIKSIKVKPPRIAESPVALECERIVTLDVGPNSSVIIGRVVFMHVQDNIVTDASRHHVDTAKMQLVSRMGGGGRYGRTGDTFQMPRVTPENWMMSRISGDDNKF